MRQAGLDEAAEGTERRCGMRQYCRYCGNCIEGDCFYCMEKEEVLSASSITRPNSCKDYGYCGIDLITGKDHVIRKRTEKVNDGEQMSLI